ncbi:MAG TPA: FtsX-like permease family protein [Kofleriaceae bacterium]
MPAWLAQADVAPRRIAGRVVAHAAPVAGAIVKLALRLGTDSLQPFTETTSSADGTFDFGVQPAAVFVVSAADATHAAVQKTIVLADPRVKPDELVLELADCRAHLSGLVRDAGGGAIANAHLATAGTSGADSDRTGRYNICLTPNDAPGPSTTSVRVDADGYGSVAEQISVVGELHHDFVLAPEAILIGRVMVGNQPVFGARVTATPDISERAHRVVGSWAESDRDGHFRIGGLALGRFQLEAFGDHLDTSTRIPAIARSAATSHEIRLAVTTFARIRGRVVMDGAPVAGAAVAVATNAPSQPSTASISQADGSLVLDRVPYGSVKLVAPPYDVRTPTSFAVAVATIDGVELEVGKLKTMRSPRSRKFRVTGLFDSGFDEYDRRLMYCSLKAAQDLEGRGDQVMGVEMKLKNISRASMIADRLEKALGGPPYQVQDWYELNKNLFTALKLQKLALVIILTLIIIVATVNMVSALTMMVTDKTREIAILKSMGSTSTSVARIFVILGAAIGGIGTAIGVGIGLVTCFVGHAYGYHLDPKVYLIDKLPIDVVPIEIAAVVGITLAISLLATLVPSQKAAALTPVEGLRYD